MLKLDQTVLVVVDMQVKLLPLIHDHERLIAECCRLVRGIKVLEAPILWAQQNPKGLGPTHPEVAALLAGEPIDKLTFSCWGEPAFRQALERSGRRQVLVAGIESHVCVAQTALDLLAAGCEVHVVRDATSSRTADNLIAGLERMRDAGATLTSIEMALFELMGRSDHPKFKQILPIVK